MWEIGFFINSILLGVGLAMDAFSVSIANGLADPHMRTRRVFLISGCFAFFQFLMPMLGWLGVTFVADVFTGFSVAIPWIALILLGYIGGKMVYDGVKARRENNNGQNSEDGYINSTNTTDSATSIEITKDNKTREVSSPPLTLRALFLQGVATSIDALSVGFTIADYSPLSAFVASVIIAVVTLLICLLGLKIGRRLGLRFAGSASILGGVILIFIGLEIFIKNLL